MQLLLSTFIIKVLCTYWKEYGSFVWKPLLVRLILPPNQDTIIFSYITREGTQFFWQPTLRALGSTPIYHLQPIGKRNTFEFRVSRKWFCRTLETPQTGSDAPAVFPPEAGGTTLYASSIPATWGAQEACDIDDIGRTCLGRKVARVSVLVHDVID